MTFSFSEKGSTSIIAQPERISTQNFSGICQPADGVLLSARPALPLFLLRDCTHCRPKRFVHPHLCSVQIGQDLGDFVNVRWWLATDVLRTRPAYCGVIRKPKQSDVGSNGTLGLPTKVSPTASVPWFSDRESFRITYRKSPIKQFLYRNGL